MRQPFPRFIGPTYQSASKNFDAERAINLYQEINENQSGKDRQVGMLIGGPGTNLLASIGVGPIRGEWYVWRTSQYFVVSGNTLYLVTPGTWAPTSCGTLQTSTGFVDMKDNGLQLFLVDGPNGYFLTLSAPTTTFTQTSDPNWQGSNRIGFQDGYFIFAVPGSPEFYLSDLNATTFTAPANTDKNGDSDNIVTFLTANRYLWLFGSVTSEVWYDSGAALNPFAYIQGTLMEYGCAAAFSACVVANTPVWLGTDREGALMVFQASGFQPQRISNHSVERALLVYNNTSKISDATAFSYSENGHQFYVLIFPTANATWAYDFATGQWHERAYFNQGQLQRIRANCFSNVNGTLVVGDYANGNLYQLSSQFYSDNGNPLLRRRVSPNLSSLTNNQFISSFQLDIETGVGLDGLGQGTAPLAMLQTSKDGGHTWSTEVTASVGLIGHTKDRAIWRQLGASRNMVYQVSITDPVPVRIMNAVLEMEAGE